MTGRARGTRAGCAALGHLRRCRRSAKRRHGRHDRRSSLFAHRHARAVAV